ncbi:MAG: hypothetical protein IAE80_23085 [Anaerolinea sp.]|nr:hypothetical protein [Anaerolinea sp.]
MSSTQQQGVSNLLKRLRPPEGQALVWWLIDMQRGWLAQIIAFALFLLAFRFIFAWSWSMAVAMLLSMFLHECGHAFVFWRAGIRFNILFLFPLGAVAAPINQEENARSDELHWNTISWLLQAGPAVNVALMLVGVVGQNLSAAPEISQFARDLIYVNGLLASMNLVPLWTLDAGQLFKVIYSSLNEQEDTVVTGALLVTSVVVLLFVLRIPGFVSWAIIAANLLSRLGWVIFLFFFAIGILNKQAHDNPAHAQSKQAMSNGQVAVQVIVYLSLVGLTLWMFAGAL